MYSVDLLLCVKDFVDVVVACLSAVPYCQRTGRWDEDEGLNFISLCFLEFAFAMVPFRASKLRTVLVSRWFLFLTVKR